MKYFEQFIYVLIDVIFMVVNYNIVRWLSHDTVLAGVIALGITMSTGFYHLAPPKKTFTQRLHEK
jgi:hypothetical protein